MWIGKAEIQFAITPAPSVVTQYQEGTHKLTFFSLRGAGFEFYI